MKIYVYGTKYAVLLASELLQILCYLKIYNGLVTVHFEYGKYQVDILRSANNTYLFGLRELFGKFILYVYS